MKTKPELTKKKQKHENKTKTNKHKVKTNENNAKNPKIEPTIQKHLKPLRKFVKSYKMQTIP